MTSGGPELAVLAPGTEPAPDDHVLGDPAAPVTLLEYGDCECPYCGAAQPVLRQLLLECEGRVRLVFRNFPLADVHPYALTAALAAEAAAEQDAFWAMNDQLFAHQDRLTDADLRRYAEEIGIDGSRVIGEAAQAFGDKVESDFAAGVLAGVPGTPSLFIQGRLYTGRVELGALRREVGAAADPMSGRNARFEPGPRRQRRWPLCLRRAQGEALPEEPQQEDAEHRGGD